MFLGAIVALEGFISSKLISWKVVWIKGTDKNGFRRVVGFSRSDGRIRIRIIVEFGVVGHHGSSNNRKQVVVCLFVC